LFMYVEICMLGCGGWVMYFVKYKILYRKIYILYVFRTF